MQLVSCATSLGINNGFCEAVSLCMLPSSDWRLGGVMFFHTMTEWFSWAWTCSPNCSFFIWIYDNLIGLRSGLFPGQLDTNWTPARHHGLNKHAHLSLIMLRLEPWNFKMQFFRHFLLEVISTINRPSWNSWYNRQKNIFYYANIFFSWWNLL